MIRKMSRKESVAVSAKVIQNNSDASITIVFVDGKCHSFVKGAEKRLIALLVMLFSSNSKKLCGLLPGVINALVDGFRKSLNKDAPEDILEGGDN